MNKTRPYQICTRCIMDTSDKFIEFDDDGVCNHCKTFDRLLAKVPTSSEAKKEQLEAYIKAIKEAGRGKQYDCVSGVSGGVDSTYLTYLLKQWGLRVLVVHLDNGWNSEMAVKNVENIVTKLGFDLYTKVLDWEEFKQLQIAYLKASVLDLEALSDHAIFATLYDLAAKNDIKYILSGGNNATEGILPVSWRYDPKITDAVNIKSINAQFGVGRIKDFPLMSYQKYIYYTQVKKIKTLSLLNYVDYVKDEAKQTIISELDWKDYGGKHYESIITRFYQGYILPNKFGIDKRRAHLATLVASGQMPRPVALEKLKEPIMDASLLKQDLEYVPKKLGLSSAEFQEIMDDVPKEHTDYDTDAKFRERYLKLTGWVKRLLTKES